MKSRRNKPNSDWNHTFQLDSSLNGIQLDAESIRKVYINLILTNMKKYAQ